jgi:hypothetical protein
VQLRLRVAAFFDRFDDFGFTEVSLPVVAPFDMAGGDWGARLLTDSVRRDQIAGYDPTVLLARARQISHPQVHALLREEERVAYTCELIGRSGPWLFETATVLGFEMFDAEPHAFEDSVVAAVRGCEGWSAAGVAVGLGSVGPRVPRGLIRRLQQAGAGTAVVEDVHAQGLRDYYSGLVFEVVDIGTRALLARGGEYEIAGEAGTTRGVGGILFPAGDLSSGPVPWTSVVR